MLGLGPQMAPCRECPQREKKRKECEKKNRKECEEKKEKEDTVSRVVKYTIKQVKERK